MIDIIMQIGGINFFETHAEVAYQFTLYHGGVGEDVLFVGSFG